MVRERRLNVLISEEEFRTLRRVAESEGVTASDVVRTLIRNRFRQIMKEKYNPS